MYTVEQKLNNEHYMEVRYPKINNADSGSEKYIFKDIINKDKDLDKKNKDFVSEFFIGCNFRERKAVERNGITYNGVKYNVNFTVHNTIRVWNPAKCEIIKCGSLEKYIKEVNKLIKTNNDKNVYFRGQASIYDWLPSLYRDEKYVENEYRLNLNVLSKHVDEFKDCRTTIEKLIKLKHFNQPSRLLDIVANPLMALYFAAETSKKTNSDGMVAAIFSKLEEEKYTLMSDTVLLLSNLSNVEFSSYFKIDKTLLKEKETNKVNSFIDELSHQCRVEIGIDSYYKNNKPDNLNKCIIIHPELNNPRIIQQQGLFILCGFDDTKKSFLSLPLDSYNSFFLNEEGKRVYFLLSYKALKEIYHQLDTYGINKSQVYFDLEKTIEYEKEKLG